MQLENAASIPETESAGIVNPEPVSTPAAEPASKVDSLDDILGAAIKEKRGQATDGTVKDTTSPADDRPRDASGKFIPKDQAGDKTPKVEPGPAPEIKTPELKPQTSAMEAPAHWSPEQKATFAKLDPAGQKFLLDRYKDTEATFTRKSQELSDTAKYADSVRSLFTEQDRQRLAIHGMDDVGFVRQLKGLYDFAASDPVSYVKWAMQQFGVSPDKLGFSAATGSDPSDPALTERQEAGITPQTVQQLVQQGISQFQAQQQRQQFQSQVDAFKGALDDKGQPKYPHFDRVRGTMARLYVDGPDGLAKAYEAAVRADPELYQAEMARLQANKADEDRKAAELAKARQASAPVKHQGTVPAVTDTRGQSLDDVLKTTIAEVRGKRT